MIIEAYDSNGAILFWEECWGWYFLREILHLRPLSRKEVEKNPYPLMPLKGCVPLSGRGLTNVVRKLHLQSARDKADGWQVYVSVKAQESVGKCASAKREVDRVRLRGRPGSTFVKWNFCVMSSVSTLRECARRANSKFRSRSIAASIGATHY